jgi:hypothetical protein
LLNKSILRHLAGEGDSALVGLKIEITDAAQDGAQRFRSAFLLFAPSLDLCGKLVGARKRRDIFCFLGRL